VTERECVCVCERGVIMTNAVKTPEAPVQKMLFARITSVQV
jgi:hypothetical protein